VLFSWKQTKTSLTRPYRKTPFVPTAQDTAAQAEHILQMQAHALAKRVSHVRARTLVLGISGGLDSTLALLVAARAADLLSRPRTDILGITMPCFGTTGRTLQNSLRMMELLGISSRTVHIANAVRVHLSDIGHSEDEHDVAYENAQARERTQILMDVANTCGGIVVGTGDLSELALGWATFNGDHMSMYGVNAGVTKTLVRALVAYEAERLTAQNTALADTLYDVLDTPVSPELLPGKDGEIVQKTEDHVGPYVLHDFFLYHFVSRGTSPKKLLRIAQYAFRDDFAPEVVARWLRVFFSRFFSQQFKRNCLPDGVAVTGVSLSPRGAWSMPSDAVSADFLGDL